MRSTARRRRVGHCGAACRCFVERDFIGTAILRVVNGVSSAGRVHRIAPHRSAVASHV